MTKFPTWIVAAALAMALTALAAVGDDDQGPRGQERRPRLTPEQRQRVRKLFREFRADMRPLRAALRQARERLRELRENEAGREAVRRQMEVVRQRAQAIRARIEKFWRDLKQILPPEVYRKWRQRADQRRRRFQQEQGRRR